MNRYSQGFYKNRNERTIGAARSILSILLEQVPGISSAVDIGCGVGTWLAVLSEMGVQQIRGYDGKWVDPKLLVIPQECFTQVDLGAIQALPNRYDLAISLEVAEHLPPEKAADFVALLTGLSDQVLFSAAIPYQGGSNHVNEQWQGYWAGLFAARGYEVQDFIRPRIWNDERILFWYRQNILFFSRRAEPTGNAAEAAQLKAAAMPLNLIHPDLYLYKATQPLGVLNSFRLFLQALAQFPRRVLAKFGPGPARQGKSK